VLTSGGRITRVKLLGVTPPDSVDVAAYHVLAAQDLAGFLVGRAVRLEYEGAPHREKDGRVAEYIYRADGLFVNREAIRRGYGAAAQRPSVVQADLRAAEAAARAAGLGLWAPGAGAEYAAWKQRVAERKRKEAETTARRRDKARDRVTRRLEEAEQARRDQIDRWRAQRVLCKYCKKAFAPDQICEQCAAGIDRGHMSP
jgi:hypothetical protein